MSARSNTRKFIITMTDGVDGSSSNNEQDVITLAKSKSIPVYTVGFGSGSDTTTLKNIATESNASFFNVKSSDISNVFQGIQTNITYQYKATISNAVTTGDTLQLSINYNGETTTRNIQK
ncbi:MAG TPA: VWA domain-containing protein [Thiothrix sp.]|nr:VWA domain-containing protein [Thiothrix sp.]